MTLLVHDVTVLVIDNYDSFVHNLARYFQRLGRSTVVVRNTEIDAARIGAAAPEAVVISPGPCDPRHAGCSLDVVRQLHAEIPMLGVCLGHQVIAEAMGAKIVRAIEPVHGRTSQIVHHRRGVFADLPSPLLAARYHSLVVEEASLPPSLEVTARTEDGVVMAIQHERLPIVGLQFHPESVLTEHGYAILAAFLRLARLPTPKVLPTIDCEFPCPASGS